MLLNYLVLKNYRNFLGLNFNQIGKNINIISGHNAVGKTNLIESINYLSYGRSFRGVPDQKLILEGKDFSDINGFYSSNNHKGKIEIRILGDSKKWVKINGLPITKISELFGNINTIVFSPDDLKIVKDSPGLRRRLIDIELSKISKLYYMNLRSYNQVIKEKNRLLKEKQIDNDILDTYDQQLARYGTAIMKERDAIINDLSRNVEEIYGRFDAVKETISLDYQNFFRHDEISEERFSEVLSKNREKEKEYGLSLIGPHRDDINIKIDGKEAKIFASQGQQRTIILALKLSILKIAEKKTGDPPILLLDDVFSELDYERRINLIDMIGDYQVFITTTDFERYRGNIDYYKIDEGKIIKL